MKISLLIEGRTEKAFLPHLRRFLETRLYGKMPNIDPVPYHHAAQHDFEAWLLAYWADIVKLAGHNKRSPGKNPEDVNHDKPPAHRIKELFELGACRNSYVKPRDANRILQGKDLLVSANACPELKAFLNTILQLCGGEIIP